MAGSNISPYERMDIDDNTDSRMNPDDVDRGTLENWLSGIHEIRNGERDIFLIPTIFRQKVLVVTESNADFIEKQLRESFAHIDPDLIEDLHEPTYTQDQIEECLAELMSTWTMDEIREAARPQHGPKYSG